MSQIVFIETPQDNINAPPPDRLTLFVDSDSGLKVKSPSNLVTPISAVLSNALPTTIGTSNPGTSSASSRGDHTHSHGNLAGGSLHAPASPTSSGFMSSSDKAYVDSLSGFNQGNPAGLSPSCIIVTYEEDDAMDPIEIDVDISMHTILCDATDGALTVRLPLAANGTLLINVKKIDVSANVVTVLPADSSGELIDGAADYELTTQYESVTIHSDGIDAWHVI